MRLVQITIPSGKRETILRALDDEGVDYVVSDETSGREFAAIAYIPLPTNAVQPVLATLSDAGLDEDAYTVVVDASTVVSRRFEQLQERYAEEHDEDLIARTELTTKARELAPGLRTYAAMTITSAVIATAGLLLDSPAVVVGSMVIAPLVGPAMAASVGTVVDDHEMFVRGVRLQIGGLLLSILSAAVFAFVVRQGFLVPPLLEVSDISEIRERVAPDFLSLIVALGAGSAGIISLTSGVSTALVGVMIAVALIPPAAVVGIGIAWGEPMMALGSTVLLLVNVLSINLAALVVLWYFGYRPQHWFRQRQARSATLKRVGILVVSILVLSAFLGGVTLDSYNRATTENEIRSATMEELEAVESEIGFSLELVEMEVGFTNRVVFREPTRLTVTVGVPPGERLDGLASRFADRVNGITDREIEVQVRYVESESA